MFQLSEAQRCILGCLRSLTLALADSMSPLTLSQIFHLTHGLDAGSPWTHSLGVATGSLSVVICGGSEQLWGPAFDLPSARIAEFTAVL